MSEFYLWFYLIFSWLGQVVKIFVWANILHRPIASSEKVWHRARKSSVFDCGAILIGRSHKHRCHSSTPKFRCCASGDLASESFDGSGDGAWSIRLCYYPYAMDQPLEHVKEKLNMQLWPRDQTELPKKKLRKSFQILFSLNVFSSLHQTVNWSIPPVNSP